MRVVVEYDPLKYNTKRRLPTGGLLYVPEFVKLSGFNFSAFTFSLFI
jgi:hypothetical protein